MRFYPKRSEGGFAHLAIVFLVVVLILGAGIAVFAKVKSSDEESQKASMSSQSADVSPSSGTSLQINQRNTARKNDASRLLGAVTEYANNNNGQLPTMFEDGQITGSAATVTPVIISFDMFTSVKFVSGHQSPATATSELRLVTQAACGDNGATTSGTSRSYVVQFVLEKVGGGHTSDCKEG
jgi:hypothetical protein